ncbi:PD-(D/E)XK nuclease-like domain-containing protein [uncultured Hyphomonas sp.]|uniref:PD-(D/E)XK nuclease-like domain-containing protein n=1 Tax=uncultured Hyphomonas sp. TaxID=225298 RepID=UPI000C4DD8EF|nr:hypothetical protein [Hyphomonadaceae bacterium]MBA30127.1 hypothetical protein [Hyphomonadaceae bacterium]QDP63686.1 MAG: putative exodeoxyribonuclease 8 [Prokaryotic dsDNA virus sp.]|tara:strand:+ start:39994 stop:40935 length:942 start_codon:yes stop_codon:yes gene_type:complete
MTPITIKDGEKVTRPGIYFIPIQRYHHDADLFDGLSISNTGLRKIEACPEKFWDSSPMNPEHEAEPETSDMRFGRMAHVLCVEKRWPSDIVISPYDDFRTKEAKEWKAAQEADGFTVFKEKDVEDIKGMAARLEQEPLMDLALAGGIVEASLIWKDEATGIWIKSRPDMIPNDNILADYKTTTSGDKDEIERSIWKYGYHGQMALMAEGMAKVLGHEMESFSFVFQEKKRPYPVTVAAVTDESIHWGARQNRFALDRLARCLEANDWPSYSEGPVTVGLPPYALKRLRDHDEILPKVPTLAEMAKRAPELTPA